AGPGRHRAGLRRRLPEDVVALPGLLRGRLRVGLPRRPPARLREEPLMPAAPALAALVEPLFGGELPVRLRAWDGSEHGPKDAPVVVLRSRKALRRLAWNPGELGLAQAYVTGELDVEGDL